MAKNPFGAPPKRSGTSSKFGGKMRTPKTAPRPAMGMMSPAGGGGPPVPPVFMPPKKKR